jgi:hypothetical protein
MAMPGPKDPKAGDTGELGPDPIFVLSITMQCDATALHAFLPFGHMPQASFPCKQTVSRKQSAIAV